MRHLANIIIHIHSFKKSLFFYKKLIKPIKIVLISVFKKIKNLMYKY